MALPPEQPSLVPHPILPGLSYNFMFLSIYDFIYYDFMVFFLMWIILKVFIESAIILLLFSYILVFFFFLA